MKNRFKVLGATMAALVLATTVAPAQAQSGMSPAQVIALALRNEGKVAYKAVRTQQVIRQDAIKHASAKVDFVNGQNYQIAISSPKEINGLNLVLDKGRMTAYFPQETLVFQSDIAAGSEEAKDLILGKLTENPGLLARNYKVTLDPEMDIVALYPCYKLTFEPVRGLGAQSPPGRRVWVSKDTGAIMREERYWTHDMAAYFQSQYDSFSTSQKPELRLVIPKEASKLKLAKGSPTNMTRYPSIEAARADGKSIYAPGLVPQGFQLTAVDVMSLYGTDIVIIRYHDGLNNMAVTYRTKENSFLTLMAGAFALSLVGKISELAYHAPNNYAVTEKGGNYVYAYGDLYMDLLKQVADSVPVPAAQPPQGAKAS